MKRVVGVDFKVPIVATPKLTTVTATLTEELPFPDATFDVVTLLAVLEHLSYPRATIREVFRVLKPGGQVVLTVPSLVAKSILEIRAYKISMVSETEVRDHKCYYDGKLLETLFAGSGLQIDRHRYFRDEQLPYGNKSYYPASHFNSVDVHVACPPIAKIDVRAPRCCVAINSQPSLDADSQSA